MRLLRIVFCLGYAVLFVVRPCAADSNRFTYLDQWLDPYYVHEGFPKLVTPQWLDEPGVEAVVVLAIDDMRDTAKYESYLRPILARLKQIDGRASLSIMTNRVDPDAPQLTKWIKEGVSIEVHTIDHPCPCLAGGDFEKAKSTYDRCVDLLNQIAGNRPVAFRMPCCDSRNTPSPRFWSEIFNRTTAQGNYLSIDSSVFNIFTAQDKELPRDLVTNEDGTDRFQRYLPFSSFVNTIENYPYPYVIGRLCWQFPCVVPSDWEAQHVQRPNNPRTVEDMKAALDATVIKQGVFNLVFHPHGWIRNDQIVDFIDYAASRYGKRVKFLSFREALQQLNQHLLAGHPLRDAHGRDNGVRLLDLDHDGYLDVVIGNDQTRATRRWLPGRREWITAGFPTVLVDHQTAEDACDAVGARFASLATQDGHQAVLLVQNEQISGAWRYDGSQWVADGRLLQGLELDGQPLLFSRQGRDRGVRLQDIDGDGVIELIVANPDQNAAFQWSERKGCWVRLAFGLPGQIPLVDEKGRDAGLRFLDLDKDGGLDIVFSNHRRFGVYLLKSMEEGWATVLRTGQRGQQEAIPMIADRGANRGVWFHSQYLWAQNENTDRLPDGVDRLSFADMLRPQSEATGFPPARSPQASLAEISTRPGMKVELVASEPLISDPVAFDWGPDGRLWVVEMRDYPEGQDGNGQPGGRVKVLQDTDNDGRYDHASVFLDQLSYPTAVKVWRKGVLVLASPYIIYAEDSDGDGRADVRETLFRGFRKGNPQHLANGLRWGLDNWLYVANGDSGGMVTAIKSGNSVRISGQDLRIRVDEGQLDQLSGQTQYGRNRDDWGNWFGGNNSDPMWHYVLEDRYLRRNKSLIPPDVRHRISVQPGAAPVFPTSRTLERFNDFEKVNRFTSACSPIIYRDILLGADFYGNAFVCEPVHNLVHREVVSRVGVRFESRRADDEQQSEFLASKDNWFRPTMIRTGPDGALWIADMYRLVIEHPEWIPLKWQRKLNLREGTGLGRIYRVRPENVAPRPFPRLDQMDTAELVAALDSPNGWQRDMAQQMILWRGDHSAAQPLEKMLAVATRPQARLHAMCTLDGLGVLRNETLAAALSDRHPAVVRHAVRLSEPRLGHDARIEAAVLATLDNSDATVHLQLACSLGGWADRRAWQALGKLAVRYQEDVYVRAAVLSSLAKENVAFVFQQVMADPRGAESLEVLVIQLAEMAAALGDKATINQVFEGLLTSSKQFSFRWRVAAAKTMLTVLQRRGFLTSQQISAESREAVDQLKERARSLLRDARAVEEDRKLALALLGHGYRQQADDVELVASLMSAHNPPELQIAAVEALVKLADDRTPQLLLANWVSHTPELRARILDALLSRTTWTEQLLKAIEQRQVHSAHIDARWRQILLRYDDEIVRQLAATLLAESSDSDRAQVLRAHQDVLQLASDVARGKTVFAKRCATCHQLEGTGHAVGPNLSTLTNRSADALLTEILDPNKAMEDRFLDYIVALDDGRQLNGVLARETSTSIVLLGQEGKQVEILRTQIVEIRSSGKSLMPEGLEKDMSKQDLADVIAYVASKRAPPKSFPGNQPSIAPVRDDGSIRLLAMHSRIYGPTLVFEQKYRNLGYWQSVDDHAVWSLDHSRSGWYRVVIDYACPDNAAGDTFVIEVAGRTLGGRVVGTGSWDTYRSKSIGKISLPEGAVEVIMRSDGPIRSTLFDLRAIRLHPTDE